LAGGMMLNRALETLSQEVTQSSSRQELRPLPPAEQFMIPERWWRSTANNRESSSWDIDLEEGLNRIMQENGAPMQNSLPEPRALRTLRDLRSNSPQGSSVTISR
jgi:hypothetical protein